eukprot:900142-Prymnesium_polylepis.1
MERCFAVVFTSGPGTATYPSSPRRDANAVARAALPRLVSLIKTNRSGGVLSALARAATNAARTRALFGVLGSLACITTNVCSLALGACGKRHATTLEAVVPRKPLHSLASRATP